MTLSIITVNLNNRNGFQRTIDSVISQTFTDYEWIVIDGGSNDGSRELIKQYSDHFAYWCSEPDKGVYNAMNKGIAHAKGEWLQFLNSGDSLIDSNTLYNVFNSSHSSDIIYGNAIVEINKNNVVRTYSKEISLSYLINHPINHQASFYRKSLYSNRLFDENYVIVSDYLFLIETALAGAKFEYIDCLIAFTEGNGLSSSKMGIDETIGMKQIIPELIQRDVDYISQIKKQEQLINSHKLLKFTNKITSIINRVAEEIVLYIETKRMK